LSPHPQRLQKFPAENVLGEIGKGHVIAFNILKSDASSWGAMCVGGARVALENAIGYAKQAARRSSKVIADFGPGSRKASQHGHAHLRRRSFGLRTVGMMDVALAEVGQNRAPTPPETRKSHRGIRSGVLDHQGLGSEMIELRVDR